MLAGYVLLSHSPGRQPHDTDPHLEELRRMAEKDPRQREFAERLRDLEEQRRMERTPPYRPLGMIAFYAGLLLFVAAGVRMYRQNPSPHAEEELQEENPSG
jgi:hypothetical protein